MKNYYFLQTSITKKGNLVLKTKKVNNQTFYIAREGCIVDYGARAYEVTKEWVLENKDSIFNIGVKNGRIYPLKRRTPENMDVCCCCHKPYTYNNLMKTKYSLCKNNKKKLLCKTCYDKIYKEEVYLFYAKIIYTMDKEHPDFNCNPDNSEYKRYDFADIYRFSVEYYPDIIDCINYIKEDLALVAGGGYTTDHIHNIDYQIEMFR